MDGGTVTEGRGRRTGMGGRERGDGHGGTVKEERRDGKGDGTSTGRRKRGDGDG